MHEAEQGDVLLLHNETHRSHNLLCTLLRTVETDLGLGHLEQITKAQEADLSLEAIVPKPAAAGHGNLAYTGRGYLLTKLLPESAILPQVVASNSLPPDQFGSWVGSRRGPPLA